MIGKQDVKEVLAQVVEGWGWRGTVDELMLYWFSTGNRLHDDVLELVHTLRSRGVWCYMATNQEKYRGQYLREKLGMHFEDVFISADIGCKKDQHEFWGYVFQKVGNQAGGKKSHVLLVDDDEKNVEAAKRFGIDGLHFRQFSDLAPLLR